MEKGFTLIELLIVIAIVAILSTVVVLVLNPAQLLAQARDSNRISDLNTLKSAMLLYLNDGGTQLAADYSKCYNSTTTTCFGTTGYGTTTLPADIRVATGGGWVGGNASCGATCGPNFSSLTSGAPFSVLPIDPTNSSALHYSYVATSTNSQFEFAAIMESTKFANTGGSDVESTDGGNDPNAYEVGTKLNF